MWGVLHERPTRHGRGRERKAQLTEPVKGKPPTTVLRTLDRICQPCNDVNKRSERAATPLGASLNKISNGGAPHERRRNLPNLQPTRINHRRKVLRRRRPARMQEAAEKSNKSHRAKIKTTPLTLKGTGGSFYLEGFLLMICSVSYSSSLTWRTAFGIVYHLGEPAFLTVFTRSSPPSGRAAIAIHALYG